MSTNTQIEWADKTWSPLVGCDPVSPGCANCYAMLLHNRRFLAWKRGRWPDAPAQYHKPFGVVQLLPERLPEPLHWRKPVKVFVNSQSDLFHEDVPAEFIDRVFAIMAVTPQHTYQILTKRPERMADYFAERYQFRRNDGAIGWQDRRARVEYEVDRMDWNPKDDRWWDADGNLKALGFAWPLPNVWLGVSVEDQAAADARIPHLLRTPAAVRFLSCEPLLSTVDLRAIPDPDEPDEWRFDALQGGWHMPDEPGADCDGPIWGTVDWVIAGGESGPHARPMHPDWARSLRDQCAAAGVAFFFKQWGEWWPAGHGIVENARMVMFGDEAMYQVGKKRAGRLLDGVEHDEFPAVGG